MARIEIADLLSTQDVWTIPDWPAIANRVAAVPEAERSDAWAEATRQWLKAFATSLGGDFAFFETDRAQVLTVNDEEFGRFLLRTVRYCREELESLLRHVGRFDAPGREVVLCFPTSFYYSYTASFYPDAGEYGGSGGMHDRNGYPHVLVNGINPQNITNVVAHEMTHGVLHGLDSPMWLEEGIAQFVERAVGSSNGEVLTGLDAKSMPRHWTRHGLAAFWWGHGFGAAEPVQRYSYQLADILLRILIEDHRPGWFGFGRHKLDRLHGFIRGAKAEDAGQASAKAFLGFDLGQLAAKFLGEGDWNPRDEEREPRDATGELNA